MAASTQNLAVTRRSAVSLAASAVFAGLGLSLRAAPAPAEPAALAEPVAQTVADLVYAVEEPAGTRVVTPFYSVLVPSGLVGERFGFGYVDVPPSAGEANGTYMCHVLTVSLGSSWFEVFCHDPQVQDWDTGWPTAPAAVQSSDGLSVAVLASPDLDDAWAKAADLAALVEPAAAPEPWALPPRAAWLRTEAGTLVVATPGYAVELPADLAAAEGFALSYVGGLPASCSAEPGYSGRVLYVQTSSDGVSSRHFEVRCVAPGSNLAVHGAYESVGTGVVTQDGLEVAVLVPRAGLGGPNDALALAELYAGYVRPVAALAGAVFA